MTDRCPRCRHLLTAHRPVSVRAPQPNNEATPPRDTGYRCTACRCRKAPFVPVLRSLGFAALVLMAQGMVGSVWPLVEAR